MLRGEKLGDDRQLLTCEDQDREMADVRARPDVMARIARVSGGQVISTDPKDSSRLAYVFGSRPPATVEYRRTALWDKSWWLGTLLGLLTLEWVLRRVSGMA
jgi:hypothetical protein